jgi:F-type H+-transporting ATPase subunit alpha
MDAFTDYLEQIKRLSVLETFSVLRREEGRVISIGDDVARVSGLMGGRMYEILEFESGDTGIAYNLERDFIGVVLLSSKHGVSAEDRVFKTGSVSSIGVGDELLGRVIDPLGNPLDGRPAPAGLVSYNIEREAPPLIKREYVSRPLYTGVKAVDAMLPIGRGQRELIIGDPSTGKTSIAVSAVASQKRSDVISIYACIGQRKGQVRKIIEEVREYGDLSRTVFVVADASDSLGLQFIAPYSAIAIAEYFMDHGRDVLIIYDDLTKHAKAYRSISLLLKRPPGREAYPGDIFFIHSRLLERSANISGRYGGGSITALPLVETQQGRISAYIPTNLISITDGQIYLDLGLFNKGIRPAIDIGKSVSRIGGKAQTDIMRNVSERLKIDYSRFLEAEVFTKFGAKVEDETARLIQHGERLREILKQPRFRMLPMEDEVLNFFILDSGALEGVDLNSVDDVCGELTGRIKKDMPDIVNKIREMGRLSAEGIAAIKKFFREGVKDVRLKGNRE